jgi:hypothetical protein
MASVVAGRCARAMLHRPIFLGWQICWRLPARDPVPQPPSCRRCIRSPGRANHDCRVAMSPTSSTAAMSLTSAVLIEPQQEPLHHSCHRHHRTCHGFGDQRASSPSSSTMKSARCSECQQHATNANISGQEQSYLMELEAFLQFK